MSDRPARDAWLSEAANEATRRLRDNFPGHGMKPDNEPPADSDDLTAELAADLAKELPTQTAVLGEAVLGGLAALEKSIAEDKAEKARLQHVVSDNMGKIRQLTSRMRAKEDFLDSLLASEA